MDTEKIREALEGAASLQDASRILEDNGINLTPEQLQAIAQAPNSEELDETALGVVTGGSVLGGIGWIVIKSVVQSVFGSKLSSDGTGFHSGSGGSMHSGSGRHF